MDQEPENEPQESPVLAELYRGLAHAHMQGEDLDRQLREHRDQLIEAQQQLQDQVREYEEAGDQEGARRAQDQLDQVREAITVAAEQLDEDPDVAHQHQDREGQPDERDRDSDRRRAGP